MLKKNSQPQHIGVCAILINPENKFLLGKRKNSYQAGDYGLPGGRIKLNEPTQQAIEREVFEETGIQNIKLYYVGVVRENQGSYDFIHFVYAAKVGLATPKLCEPTKCEGWEWFACNQDVKKILPGHQAALNLFINQEQLADLVL